MRVLFGKQTSGYEFTCRESLTYRYGEYLVEGGKTLDFSFCPKVVFDRVNLAFTTEHTKDSITNSIQKLFDNMINYEMFPGAEIDFSIDSWRQSYSSDYSLLPTISFTMKNFPISISGVSFFNKLVYPGAAGSGGDSLYFDDIKSYGGYLRAINQMSADLGLGIITSYTILSNIFSIRENEYNLYATTWRGATFDYPTRSLNGGIRFITQLTNYLNYMNSNNLPANSYVEIVFEEMERKARISRTAKDQLAGTSLQKELDIYKTNRNKTQ
jgi:hypothetical protein